MAWGPTRPEYTKAKGGGTFHRGGIYYSATKPRGVADTLKYDPVIYEKLDKVRRHGASLREINEATDILVHIGYLDKDDPDNYDAGLKDRKWQGAISRYMYNFQPPMQNQLLDGVKHLWNTIMKSEDLIDKAK
jgi:hypothetical protein